MKNILIGGYKFKSFRVNLSLALLRAVAGFSMAFGHGIGKIPPSEGFVNGVSDLGFPFPIVFAWAAGLSEFLGGIFLGLGLFTRPSALFLSFTMGVAAFMRHADDPFSAKEKALLFLFIGILFIVTGSGSLGIDQSLRRKL